MSGRKWAPGDVALVSSWRGALLPAFRTIKRTPDDAEWCVLDGGDTRGLHDSEVSQARRVAVIDYENRGEVERLTESFLVQFTEGRKLIVGGSTDAMQAALREYADPKPRIEEPTDLAARVIDKDGDEWAMASGGYWACVSKRFQSTRTWDELLRDYGPVEVRQ